MGRRLAALWAVGNSVTRDYIREGTWRMAAAIAFYSLFAAGPLLLFVLDAGRHLMRMDDVREALFGRLAFVVGRHGADSINELLSEYSFPKPGLTGYGLGLLTLVFGGVNAVGQLRESINRVWPEQIRERDTRSARGDYVVDLAFVVGFGLLLVTSLVVSALLRYAGTQLEGNIPMAYSIFRLVDSLVFVAIFLTAILLLFRYLPAPNLSWPSLFAGALVASVLFTIARGLLVFWLARGNVGSAFGSVSSMIVFLVWVYVSAQILLFGAAFTGRVEARRLEADQAAA